MKLPDGFSNTSRPAGTAAIDKTVGFRTIWTSDVNLGTPSCQAAPLAGARLGPTILILSVSAGAGHVRAAQALCVSAVGMPLNVVHLDVMQFVQPWFRRMYTDLYLKLVSRFPHIWAWLYRHMQQVPASDLRQVLRRWFERGQSRALLRKIATLQPEAIICTHFMPAELLAYLPLAKRPTCPIWVQITDFDVHRIWIQPGIAGYFTATEELAFRLRAEGVATDSIYVTGLPIMPQFSGPFERSACAHGLGLDPARRTVLLMGAGAGISDSMSIAQRLLAIDPALQLIALTGSNVVLHDALTKIADSVPGRFVVRGQTTHLERFMACSDLIVSKSGGLTSAECMAAGLPMIVNAPIPGQEERNADFLVEQGVAMKAIDPVAVEYRVRTLLADPQRLAKMAACGRANARPAAAAEVMRIVSVHLARQVH